MNEHTWMKCICGRTGCPICDGGLAACTVCGGFEGTLTTECCGRRLTEDEEERIYTKGTLDFKDGAWVNQPTAMHYRPFIMAPGHPQWREFCDRLGGPEGCNFEESADGKTNWKCDSGTQRRLARKILDSMGADVDASLEYFTSHGGHCDCEILFNVDR